MHPYIDQCFTRLADELGGPKRLRLEIQRPELREYSTATQASFQIGHHVGDVAQRIYDLRCLFSPFNPMATPSCSALV